MFVTHCGAKCNTEDNTEDVPPILGGGGKVSVTRLSRISRQPVTRLSSVPGPLSPCRYQ